MNLKKKKLLITRVICTIGMYFIWIVALGNATNIFLNGKNMIVASGTALPSAQEILKQIISATGTHEVLYRTIVLNIGITLCVAVLATALLATAIATIDLRNMNSLKAGEPLKDSQPEDPKQQELARIRSKYGTR